MLSNIKVLLIILLVLALVTYVVISKNSGQGEMDADNWLIPELQQNVNQISRIELLRKDQTVTLQQQESGWQVIEADGFYADRENIAALLMNLRSVQLLEKKTANPDNFPRLQLGPDGATVRLFQGDQPVAAVVIGKSSDTGQGSFARMAEQQQAWLVSAVNPIDVTPQYWLQKRILNVDADAIERIQITHVADNETLNIVRRTGETNAADGAGDSAFVFADMPEGQQLRAGTGLDSLASGLVNYTIEQAEPRQLNGLTQRLSLIYDTYNDLRYNVDVYALNEVYYAVIEAQPTTAETTLTAAAQQQMEQFNRRYAEWMFVIPTYKFNAVDKRAADYLEPQPQSEPEPQAEPAETAPAEAVDGV